MPRHYIPLFSWPSLQNPTTPSAADVPGCLLKGNLLLAQKKQSLRISWPDREEGKQHKHFYSAKGNLFYAEQTQATTSQFTWELPAKLRHQQLMRFRTRRTLAWDPLPRSVFSLTVSFPERHSTAWKIPGYRLKSETASCQQSKTEPSESNESVSWKHCQSKWDLSFALWFFFFSSFFK